MSESEVVFKSFKEKSEYEKKERLRRSEKEERLKKRKTKISRERNSNKDIQEESNMSLAYVVQLIQGLGEKVSMWELNAPNPPNICQSSITGSLYSSRRKT